MGEFTKVGVFFIIALIFPLLALLPSWKLQPRQPGGQKRVPYECGVDTVGRNTVQYHIGYFLYALIFLLFDMETVLLYPWAVKFRELGLFSLLELFVFLGFLSFVRAFPGRRGALSGKL